LAGEDRGIDLSPPAGAARQRLLNSAPLSGDAFRLGRQRSLDLRGEFEKPLVSWLLLQAGVNQLARHAEIPSPVGQLGLKKEQLGSAQSRGVRQPVEAILRL